MSPYRQQRAVWLMCVAGAIVLSVLLVVGGVQVQEARALSDPGLASMSPNEILSRPRSYEARTVSVRGPIGRVWSNRVIALHDRSVRSGLMVVLSDQALQSSARLRKGEMVEVIGTVRILDRKETRALEDQFEASFHRDDLGTLYALHPYILAQRIKPGVE